jgi:hypothetical protein
MIDFDLWKKLNTKKYTRLRLRVNPKNPCINRGFQFISVPRVGVQLMQSDIILILLQIDKKLIFYNTFKTFVDDYITALYLIK